jgi:hypothetical protein
MFNTVQAGWHLDNDDNIIDNCSTGSISSFNRNENPSKNRRVSMLNKFSTTTRNSSKQQTDVEGWTTTSPGKKKPKNNNNNNVASVESVITTIDGNFEQIEAGTRNEISVTSPRRKLKCNIPEQTETRTTDKVQAIPISMTTTTTTKTTGTGEEHNKEVPMEGGGETNNQSDQNNNNKNNNSSGNNGSGKNDKETDNDKEDRKESSGGPNRGGRGGRSGRGGSKTDRRQTPRSEWETYDFSISFNPKTMSNKDPDAEFQAVLSQIMRKAPGVTFHPTNEDMYPKPRSFTTIQEYPQTEAAFKDFFEVYENKGLTTYKIFVKATMQYNELELRNSLLNYLRSNNLWMSSDLIAESVDEMIGYINYGHDKMVWRPECEKKINNGIHALIQSGSIPEALRLKIKGLKKEIKIRVAAGTFRGGSKNDPVMCEGLVLRTTKAQSRASIELLGLLDENVLGEFYSIIPRGIDKELGPQLYGDLLRTNNDMLNTLRSISVVNWPEELFLDHYNPAPDVEGTVAIQIDKLFINVWKCVAIERTMETERRGKYLLIFKEEDMEKAKDSIGDLIEAFGRLSDRKCAKIALERFQEFPEFDSIQRVSQSVHSKGLRIREMLQKAATQRTTSTPKQPKQPRFQFHVNKELQQQLQIPTQKSYCSTANPNTGQKKQLTIRQPVHKNVQQQHEPTKQTMLQTTQRTAEWTANQQQDLNEQGMGISRGEWEEIIHGQGKQRASILTNATTQETRTIATNHSGLSGDQQTITTMMTQITQQFKEMERERIVREDRQEMIRQERETKAEEKREEREARMEEKRLDAQREMYKFMQTMMTINITKNQENQQDQRMKEAAPIPEELTTGTTEQTSAITTSIVTTSTSSSTPTGKRSSSLLSNTNEETEMEDNEKETDEQETTEDAMSIKRNKRLTGEVEDDIEDDEEMTIATEQQDKSTGTNETTTVTDEAMIDQGENASSFTTDFNNQQFKSTANTAPWHGVSQQ